MELGQTRSSKQLVESISLVLMPHTGPSMLGLAYTLQAAFADMP